MGPPPTLSDSFSVHGAWFVPSDPRNVVAGTLEFEPGGQLELHLTNGFRNIPYTELLNIASKSSTIPLILGRSDDGRPWSAIECIPIRLGMSAADPVELIPRYVLSGCASPQSKVAFQKIQIESTRLAEWVRPFPNQTVKMPRIRVDYSIRAKRTCTSKLTNPRGQLSIETSFSPSYGRDEIRVKAHAAWIFEPRDPVPLREALTIARDCQNFLTFVLGQGVDLTALRGQCRSLEVPTSWPRPANGKWTTREVWSEILVSMTRATGGKELPQSSHCSASKTLREA